MRLLRYVVIGCAYVQIIPLICAIVNPHSHIITTIRNFCLVAQFRGVVFVFFEKLDNMCAERGLSISAFLESLNVDKSAASRWKRGALPSKPVQKKIADYFGVSVLELMDHNKEKPTANNGDGLNVILQDSVNLEFSEKFDLLTQEQKEMIIAQMEVLIKNHPPKH